jgi:hypothetical protein
VFDALDDYRSTPTGSRWCAFLGTAAEYADAPAEVRQVLDLETTTLRQRLVSRAAPVVGPRAEALADQLLLIVSGYLAMRLRDPALDTTTARSVAASLIREHTTPDGTAPTT